MLFFTRCTINFQNVFVVVTTLTTTTTSPSFCIDLAESPSYQSPVTTDLETMMRTSVPRKRMMIYGQSEVVSCIVTTNGAG